MRCTHEDAIQLFVKPPQYLINPFFLVLDESEVKNAFLCGEMVPQFDHPLRISMIGGWIESIHKFSGNLFFKSKQLFALKDIKRYRRKFAFF